MTHNIPATECVDKFKDLKDLFEECVPIQDDHLSLENCWQALSCAKQMGWIDFGDWDLVEDNERLEMPSLIHMEEYLHYAR